MEITHKTPGFSASTFTLLITIRLDIRTAVGLADHCKTRRPQFNLHIASYSDAFRSLPLTRKAHKLVKNNVTFTMEHYEGYVSC